jgi:hypothetical protein
MSKFFRLSHIALALSLPAGAALAHVPYLEQDDYSDAAPFVVEDVTNSKSIHAALDEAVDYDVFSITIDEPTRIYTTTNIPYCPQYESFAVTYALVGPGLPAPAEALPIELPAGYGAVIVRDSFDSTDDRPLLRLARICAWTVTRRYPKASPSPPAAKFHRASRDSPRAGRSCYRAGP